MKTANLMTYRFIALTPLVRMPNTLYTCWEVSSKNKRISNFYAQNQPIILHSVLLKRITQSCQYISVLVTIPIEKALATSLLTAPRSGFVHWDLI